MAYTFKVKPGDKVAYSVQFLRSIGMSHTSMAHARGIVKQTLDCGTLALVKIDWQGADLPETVNAHNLALVGPNARFCAV